MANIILGTEDATAIFDIVGDFEYKLIDELYRIIILNKNIEENAVKDLYCFLVNKVPLYNLCHLEVVHNFNFKLEDFLSFKNGKFVYLVDEWNTKNKPFGCNMKMEDLIKLVENN